MTKQNKKQTIFLRVTDQERSLLEKRAKELGHSLSSLIRFLVSNELRELTIKKTNSVEN